MSASLRFGPFVVDRAGYRLLCDDRAVSISPKLLDLLICLLEHAGDLVTKEALLDSVWPGANVTDNALTQAVSELRQILGDDPASPRYIKTVARRGYRFIGSVARIESGADHTQAAVVTRTEPSRGESGIRSGSEGGIFSPAIAVLDFVNVTGDPETAWLCAGIAETVTGDLRSLGDFRIVDRRRVLEATAAAGSSMQAVAKETGASLIVVGSFQRNRSRIRITARLVDAAGGEALADAKVDGPVEEIFDLQDQIVVEFGREMGIAVQQASGSRIGARETTSLDAYRAFTSGWLRLETLDVDELPASIEDFRRAIAIDHRYALAHTGLASAQFASYESTRADNEPARELLDEAVDHARHAVALDDGLAEAHAALGFLLVSRWETEEAIAEARRAVALEPGNWRHHFRLGHASWGDVRLRAAEATLLHHPGFAFAHFQVAMVHVARGDLQRAESVLHQGGTVQDRQRARRERFPALGLHWLLGLVHLAQDNLEAAMDDFGRELAVADLNRLYGREYASNAHLGRGLSLLRANRLDDAIGEFEAALTFYPQHAQTHLALAEAFKRMRSPARRNEHLAAADDALGVLERTRRVEAALVRSQRLAADGRAEQAADVLLRMLAQMPHGFAGWTIPIEPLLQPIAESRPFTAVKKALSARAE